MKPTRLVVATFLLAAAASHSAFAQEVGRFALVQREVLSLKPGAAEAVAAAPGARIVLQELETTGDASGAKMTFGEGAVISLGQNTRFRVTREAVDEATGASVSTIDLLVGKMRVFVSRFWSGRPEVQVNTPTAVVGVKGSEVGIEVAEDGSTLVTVIGGEASVGLPETPAAARRRLGASQQVGVERGGGGPGEPRTVGPDELERVRSATEPGPSGSPEPTSGLPSPPPRAAAGGPDTVPVRTVAPSSEGGVWTDPATNAVPESGGSRESQGPIGGF